MRSVAVVALLMLAAGACRPAGDMQPRATVDPKDPCRLLSSEQVEDALQVEVRVERLGESRPGPEGAVPLCMYDLGAPFSTLSLHIEQPVTADEFARQIDRDPPNTERIQGIGDAAYIHAGVSIFVLEGEAVVGASVQHFEDIDATELALVRLGRVLEGEL